MYCFRKLRRTFEVVFIEMIQEKLTDEIVIIFLECQQ